MRKTLWLTAAIVAALGVGELASRPTHASTLTGMWHNTTFSSSGALSIDLTSTTGSTFTATADANGFVFGVTDPPPFTVNGTFDGSTGIATIDEPNHSFFGDINGTIGPTGVIDLAFTDIPVSGIHSMQVDGNASLTSVSGTYRVWFTDPGAITGTPIEATHFADGTYSAVPEPAGAALLGVGGLMLLARRRRGRS